MKSIKLKKKKSTLREYAEAIIIALLLALFIRTFIVQAFKIPSGSMLPTLLIGDHLLVNKFIYGVRIPLKDDNNVLIPFREPESGDIVVFRYPKDPRLDYIKRVVAVGGDKIEIRNKKIWVNGKPFADHYGIFTDSQIIPQKKGPRDNIRLREVPEGKLFVIGDNRDNSFDSRFWGFVDVDAVRGKAFITYWSWDVQYPLFSISRFTSIRWSRIGDSIR